MKSAMLTASDNSVFSRADDGTQMEPTIFVALSSFKYKFDTVGVSKFYSYMSTYECLKIIQFVKYVGCSLACTCVMFLNERVSKGRDC
jgi:hypothetical protein